MDQFLKRLDALKFSHYHHLNEGVQSVGRKQMDHKRYWMKYLIVLVSLILVACSNGGFYPGSDPESHKIPRKVRGTADAQVMALQARLAKQNVKVITIGEDYLVSIPSPMLFPDESPQLTWQSYRTLNEVVYFLQQFRKVAVNVTGFSSQYVSTRREDALTLARAKSVSNYLWSQGVDSRFIFAEGAGRYKPIVGGSSGGDLSPNSRIEITFRDAII